MLTRIGGKAVLFVLASAAFVVLGGSFAAAAGSTPVGGGGGVVCTPGTQSCTIDVNDPGTPSGSPTSHGGGTGSSGGSTGTPTSGPTLVNGDCTYAAEPAYVPLPGEDAHSGQKGAWYAMTCPDGVKVGTNIATTTTTMVWLTTPPPPALMQPTPEVMAARARNKLVLPKPQIASNPPVGRPQLVGVPTWSFLPKSVWTPVSATASVPGLSVTATATPVSVTWNYGDGTSTVCAGPGTPFTVGTDPKASSPDCGHTYRTSSGTAPGGTFKVSATISWRVDWAGAGQAGTLNNLTTTASVRVTVQQSQAIITGTG